MRCAAFALSSLLEPREERVSEKVGEKEKERGAQRLVFITSEQMPWRVSYLQSRDECPDIFPGYERQMI